MNFFIENAYAQTGGGGGPFEMLGTFVPLILIFVVFWFLLIRPQQKKAKEHRAMVGALSKGDEVVTNGGLLGRITAIGEAFLTVEVGEGMEVRIQRSAVSSLMPKGTIKSA